MTVSEANSPGGSFPYCTKRRRRTQILSNQLSTCGEASLTAVASLALSFVGCTHCQRMGETKSQDNMPYDMVMHK